MPDNILTMELILDVGSTKTEWIILDENAVFQRFTTDGFNPNCTERQCLVSIVESAKTQYLAPLPKEIQSIHYYGAGCGYEPNCRLIREVFQHNFPNAEIDVTHDLMAACHAILGYEKGIACVLGTGSNACVYDGENIVERAVSLGYLVGDEGSGMHIGREVVKTYFYGFMPVDLRDVFTATYHLELDEFLNNVYHKGRPSKYLASFARFADEHQTHPYIQELVKGCFRACIEAFVLHFGNCKTMKVCFIGSVAMRFKDLLKDCLSEYGLMMGEVMQTPAEGLIRYYGMRHGVFMFNV